MHGKAKEQVEIDSEKEIIENIYSTSNGEK